MPHGGRLRVEVSENARGGPLTQKLGHELEEKMLDFQNGLIADVRAVKVHIPSRTTE